MGGATLLGRPTLGWRDAPALAWRALTMRARPRPAARRRRAAGGQSPGATMTSATPEQYVQEKAAASGSSFYYAFLFLSPPRRAAITAFYAFCREVDDVADEVSDPGVAAVKLAWWRSEVGAAFAGTAEPSGDARPHAACGRLRDRAGAPARRDRGLPDGPRPVALSRLSRPGPLLRPGRRRRRRSRREHLRPHPAVDHRLRAPPGPRDAAHQHHPRRRRRRASQPHLPADERAEAVRGQGRGDPRTQVQRPLSCADAASRPSARTAPTTRRSHCSATPTAPRRSPA